MCVTLLCMRLPYVIPQISFSFWLLHAYLLSCNLCAAIILLLLNIVEVVGDFPPIWYDVKVASHLLFQNTMTERHRFATVKAEVATKVGHTTGLVETANGEAIQEALVVLGPGQGWMIQMEI